jgi:hypothetical protein
MGVKERVQGGATERRKLERLEGEGSSVANMSCDLEPL